MFKKSLGDTGHQTTREPRLIAAEKLGRLVGMSHACGAIEVARATLYRRRQPPTMTTSRASSTRGMTPAERERVRQELNIQRFVDKSPHQVYATLLDEGKYLCSVRTIYRILDQNKETRERRNQLTRPHYRKPELLATAPNQV